MLLMIHFFCEEFHAWKEEIALFLSKKSIALEHIFDSIILCLLKER